MTDAPRPKRRPFSKDAKIAALTCLVFDIPHKHQKLMHADQVAMLIQWHHNVYHAHDGGEHFSNAIPMLVAQHEERTAKIDIPAIAKGKRIRQNEAAHADKRLIQGAHERGARIAEALPPIRTKPKRKIQSRVNAWPPKGSRRFTIPNKEPLT